MARIADRGIPASIHGPRLLLIVTTVILLLLGLVMVYSASSIIGLSEFGDPAYYFTRQLQMIAIGIAGLAVAAWINYNLWDSRIVWLAWGVLILLLVLTFFIGNDGLGARRSLSVGPVSFQPSEFAKIAMMLVAASLVGQLRDGRLEFKDFLKLVAVALGVPILLIGFQPDLGTVVIAAVGVLAVLWFGEFPRLYILGFIGLLVAAGLAFIAIESFRQDRIAAFLDPWSDPTGNGYQIINAFYAFSNGGLFGVGLGMSHQKFLYLPAAHNDFIFAIIGEELGLLGAMVVVALFVVFLYAAFKIARNAPDLLGRVVAGTCATLIGFQAFLNIACVIGLAPITGKPLPFVSYGGTSIIAALVMVGLILSVSFHSTVPDSASRRRDQLLILEGGARGRSGGNGRGERRAEPATAQRGGRRR